MTAQAPRRSRRKPASPAAAPPPRAGRQVFIVRMAEGADGRLTGIVERVGTGEKWRFTGVEAIGPLLARMARPGSGGGEKETPT